jgi:hypothetical protein
MYSQNMMNRKTAVHRTVPFAYICSCSSNIVDDNIGEDRSKQTTMKTAVGSTARLGWKTARDEELEQSRRALPKNLIRPLLYRIAKASGSGDLLSHLPVNSANRGARTCVVTSRDERGGGGAHVWYFSLIYQVVQHPALYVGLHLSQLSMWD